MMAQTISRATVRNTVVRKNLTATSLVFVVATTNLVANKTDFLYVVE